MRIEVWSDIVCPWCYIGKRRLERALEDFAGRDTVEIVHRSFQLERSMAEGVTKERRGMLKAKYGLSDDQVTTMDERLERLAAEDGLDFDLSGGVTGNTALAHQLVQFARTRGLEGAMLERLYRAYFTEGRSVFERDALVALAAEIGLDPAEVTQALATGAFADAVRADVQAAATLGVQGVPFFVLDGRYGVSGAQPVETFVEALQKASAPPAEHVGGKP